MKKRSSRLIQQSWKVTLAVTMLFGSFSPLSFAQSSQHELPANEQAYKHKQILIPLKQAAQSIGATVTEENGQVKIVYADREWLIRIGQKKSQVNGKWFKLERQPVLIPDGNQEVLSVTWNDFSKALQVKGKWENGQLHVDASDSRAVASQFIIHTFGLNPNNPPSRLQPHIESHLSSELKKDLNMQRLIMGVSFGQYLQGKPTALVSAQVKETPVHRNVHARFTTDKGTEFAVEVRLNKDGQINDWHTPSHQPAGYQKPVYDKPRTYKEEDIIVGNAPYQLPGTLTLPSKGKGPFPVVILVHGSTANDRDTSIGAYKPFRDLAVGLAQKGIATIRYEKRTREYAARSYLNSKFTIQDESIDDALAAIQLARKDTRLDAGRLHVFGHSQGGMITPSIIEQAGAGVIKGAIVASAPPGSIEDTFVYQAELRLQAAKDAGHPANVIFNLTAELEYVKQIAAFLKNPAYSKDNLPANFPTANPYWWFDFRNYSGAKIAEKQTTPLFIIQGDNDSHVDKKFLQEWKQVLSQRNHVDYKLYPKMNHFFVLYDKPSTREEYSIPGNASQELIDDVGTWVSNHK